MKEQRSVFFHSLGNKFMKMLMLSCDGGESVASVTVEQVDSDDWIKISESHFDRQACCL